MTEPTGRCMFGATRYTLAAAPAHFSACHCGMCRRFSGGVMLAVEVPPGGVTFEGEAPKTYASSAWAERGFCGTCGSTLFWRMTAPGPHQGAMAVAAGSLDGWDGLSFAREIYIDHKPEAFAFAGDRPRLTEAEVMAEFGVAP